MFIFTRDPIPYCQNLIANLANLTGKQLEKGLWRLVAIALAFYYET